MTKNKKISKFPLFFKKNKQKFISNLSTKISGKKLPAKMKFLSLSNMTNNNCQEFLIESHDIFMTDIYCQEFLI